MEVDGRSGRALCRSVSPFRYVVHLPLHLRLVLSSVNFVSLQLSQTPRRVLQTPGSLSSVQGLVGGSVSGDIQPTGLSALHRNRSVGHLVNALDESLTPRSSITPVSHSTNKTLSTCRGDSSPELLTGVGTLSRVSEWISAPLQTLTGKGRYRILGIRSSVSGTRGWWVSGPY